jgi:cytochrome c5
MHEHHPDAIESNLDTHPAKLAIGIGVGAIALVVGIILLVNLAVGSYGSRSLKDDPVMAPEAVARRIAPVAMLAVDPNAKAPEPAKAAAPAAPSPALAAVSIPPAAPKSAGAADGKKVFDATCTACHSTGVAGAPKLGDKAAWAPRVKGGKEALYASALKGKGAMPAKGGNGALADADVKAAVDYLIAAAK